MLIKQERFETEDRKIFWYSMYKYNKRNILKRYLTSSTLLDIYLIKIIEETGKT